MAGYRSRLSKLEDKRNLRTATVMTLASVALIIGAFVVGIPLLVNLASWLTTINSDGSVDKTDLIAPPPPGLVSSYDATNSAVIEIRGAGEPNSNIYMTQNGQSAGNTRADDGGSFSFENVNLREGENVFAATAVDDAGNRSPVSALVRVFFSNKEPVLSLEMPTDGSSVSGKQAVVEIKGNTDAGNRVTVNDRLLIVDGQGRFSGQQILNPGENVLVFVAGDRAGNQNRKEIKLTYNP